MPVISGLAGPEEVDDVDATLTNEPMRTRSTDPSCWRGDVTASQAAVALIAPNSPKQGTALSAAGMPVVSGTPVASGMPVVSGMPVAVDAPYGSTAPFGTSAPFGTTAPEHDASFGVRSTDLPGPVPRGAPV